MRYDFGLQSSTWWSLSLLTGTAILLGRRGYVQYVEEGRSASEKFALRANTLPYISAWGVFAVAAVVFAFLDDDIGEAFGVFGIVFAEYVTVCLWAHYYGHVKLVTDIVTEVKKRTKILLNQGLGMSSSERYQFWLDAEKAVVDFWVDKLKRKKWNSLSEKELDICLFDTGVQIAEVMDSSLWEGVLHDVAAYSKEWRLSIRNERPRLHVPGPVISALKRGTDADAKVMLFIAILIANEDNDLRTARESLRSHHEGQQFSAARIAKRKTAGEGILRWPDCTALASIITLSDTDLNFSELQVGTKDRTHQCSNPNEIPSSILYTIDEVLKAGYLKIDENGRIQCTIKFAFGNMIFDKEDWDQSRAVERRPFRYITSSTRLQGNAAFMVEQREATGSQAASDASTFMTGNLKVKTKAKEAKEEQSWVDMSIEPQDECIWGSVPTLMNPNRCIHPLNWPMITLIRLAWAIVDGLVRLQSFISSQRKLCQVENGRQPVFRADTLRTREISLAYALEQSAATRESQQRNRVIVDTELRNSICPHHSSRYLAQMDETEPSGEEV